MSVVSEMKAESIIDTEETTGLSSVMETSGDPEGDWEGSDGEKTTAGAETQLAPGEWSGAQTGDDPLR